MLFSGLNFQYFNNADIYSNKNFLASKDTPALQKNKSNGYSAIDSYNEGFIAVGSDGRIDRISLSGKVTKTEKFSGANFNCLLAGDQFVIVAGDDGNVMISANNGSFIRVGSGTDKNINSLTSFGNVIIAGTDEGEILLGDSEGFFQIIYLDVEGNITSVSANETDCYGVTDKGEIIHSTDGINWDVFNYNEAYKGFYKSCSFTSVTVTENRIAVAGIHDDGSPAVLFSSRGSVWTERNLYFTNDSGNYDYLTDTPNDILYDAIGNQFFIVCTNGKLMSLPSCSHCNEISEFTELDLEGVACIDNILMVVGENFFLKAVNIR